MKVTREGDYGLRAVVFLASVWGRSASASEISRRQGIPQKFLARIMPKLVRKGVVISIPGSKGGYRLSRKPELITFLEVVEAVEGAILLNKCSGQNGSNCVREPTCSMKKVWKNAQTRLTGYFGEVTFDQLLEETLQ